MPATVIQILNAVAATGGGPVQNMQRHSGNNPTNIGIVQFEITGTATVALEGRCTPLAPWVVIASFTASGAQAIAQFPQMRGNVTAYTNGAISGWLSE